MPRGSDGEAAGKELQARIGMAPNAEQLIEANQARLTRELRAASHRSVDGKATEEMDQDEAQGYVEGDGEVVAWTVRGPFVVIVSEDDEGRLVKEAHPYKGKEKQAERAMRAGSPSLREQAEDAAESATESHSRRQTSSGSGSGGGRRGTGGTSAQSTGSATTQ